MAGTPMVRGGFAELLWPGLNKVYLMTKDSYPEEYTQFLNIESSKMKLEKDEIVDGFGLVPQKDEGGPIDYDHLEPTGPRQYEHLTYSMGFEITEELYEDELYGIMRQAPAALSIAVKQTVDTLAAGVLNNSFTDSAAYHGVDGVPLCSLVHPQSKALGTVANKPSVDLDFDPVALNSALVAWENWVDANDLPMMKKPKWVVSGPGQRQILVQTLGSSLQPFTSDNEINAVKEWELQKMILHYLTDDDAWWILSQKMEHFLKWFWRIKPAFRGFDDHNTGNARYVVRFRASSGFTHWPGVYGSSGG